jgi:DNA-binding transcriptional LysR family regulator
MKVTLNQLAIFAEVVRQKSITKAAKVLHRTQPAISIQIKELEKRYGVKLIDIIGKKVCLTPSGSELWEAYQAIDQQISAIANKLSKSSGTLKGIFNIAIVSTAQYFIPKLLGDFRHKYPEVEIKLTVTNRGNALLRLHNILDDVVILSQLPKDLKIHAQAVLDDQLVLIAATEHSLAKRKDLQLSELKNEHYLIREPGSGTRMAMEKIFKKQRFQPQIVMELGSGEAVKQAVMANMGISLVSKMSLEQELKLKKLVILNVQNFPVKHTWYAVQLAQKTSSPIAEEFLKFI